MVGFGLGFGSRSSSRQFAALGQNVPLSALVPSAQWTGAAGSGFSGPPPADPVRTTAKPVCRLLVPPNQYFTDELVIGVWAGANNQGSLLDDLGIERVIAHCEGQSYEITSPSFFLFDDANGNAVRYYGWWVVLQHPGMNGHAHVYFEAVPKDPAMQSRVIGPYQFSPQAVLHDYEIEVAQTPAEIAGARYKTVVGALNYLTSVGAQNPLITITESFVGDLGSANGYAGGAGYTTITATTPVTFKKPGPLIGAATLFRPGVDGLWFRGANITFDFHYAGHIYHENPANRAHVFDGIRFTDSGGRNYTYLLGSQKAIYIARDNPWFMECEVSSIPNACRNAHLVRGCLIENGYDDAASSSACVIGNRIRDWTSEEFRAELPALTVQYTGGGAAATLELSGGNETNNRVFTAKVGGVAAGTFTVKNGEADYTASTNYTVQNVVNWLNTLPGWTATLLDNSRRASALSISGNGGAAFAAIDVKTAPLTLITMFDVHGDLWQWLGNVENTVFADNLCYANSVQSIFLAPTAMRDSMVINNVFDLDEDDLDYGSFFSQLANVHSHVVVAHNSITNQNLLLRNDAAYNPDEYCLIANNVTPRLNWQGAGFDNQIVIRDNHLMSGASVPAGSTGTTVGGTKASLFLNPLAGDFTPQGELQTVLKVPGVRHDMLGVPRANPSVAGALVGAGDVPPQITSSNPSGTYAENQPIGGALVANKVVSWSVEGADAGMVTLDPVTGVWSLAATDYETKVSYAFAFVATDSAMDTATQAVAIAISDADEIAPALSSPQGTAVGTSGASLSVVTDEANGTLYWFVSTSATPPSVAAIIAGTGAVAGGSQVVSLAGAVTATVSGLSASTTYHAYYLHRDGAGNNSAIASGSSFTTDAASGGAVAVINSALVVKSSDQSGTYTGSPFVFEGGADRVLLLIVTLSQQTTQAVADLTATVDGTAMTRISGASHSLGSSRPISAIFAATGLPAGSKSISVSLAGNARSCLVMALEVGGLENSSLLANAASSEGNTLTYNHGYTPSSAGNLVLAVLATRQGDRGPFAPDSGVTELLDDTTGSTATSDHSVFVGYHIPAGTNARDVGGSTATSADALFLVTELRKA